MKLIEVLLLEDIPKLGNKGSIVKVKAGYGRNYLIPKKLAAEITKASLHFIEMERKKIMKKEKERKKMLMKVAEELKTTSFTIEERANEEEHLFGSVTYTKIAEVINKAGYNVKPDDIELEDTSLYPIKELGIYPINIRLHPEIIAKTKIWVTKLENKEEKEKKTEETQK